MDDAYPHVTDEKAAQARPVPDAAAVPVPSSVVGLALILQRTAGNRATAKWAAATSRRLQRQRRPPRAVVTDTVGAYMADEDWARAASALGQQSEDDIRARITSMTAFQRQGVIEGARHSEPAGWVATIVTIMMEIDPRSALVGSIRWARWKHEWARAQNWFHGLSLEDGRSVARESHFFHDQLLLVIGASEYLRRMFPDPWASVGREERMLHVMELLVGTHTYPVNGAAGIVGNLVGESGLIPSRIEGSTEADPMRANDVAGTVTDFTAEQVRDRDKRARVGPALPGAGLAQWTSASRRAGLFGRPQGAAILFDMDAQVAYLVDELGGSFASLNARLRAPGVTVQDGADRVLDDFERPADPEASRPARRRFAEQAATVYRRAHPAPAPAPGGP